MTVDLLILVLVVVLTYFTARELFRDLRLLEEGRGSPFLLVVIFYGIILAVEIVFILVMLERLAL